MGNGKRKRDSSQSDGPLEQINDELSSLAGYKEAKWGLRSSETRPVKVSLGGVNMTRGILSWGVDAI